MSEDDTFSPGPCAEPGEIKMFKLKDGGPLIVGEVVSEGDFAVRIKNPTVVFQETDDSGTNKFKIGTFMEIADREDFLFLDIAFKCYPNEQVEQTYRDFISQTQ